MSTVAIDNARTNELLSVFLSEIGNDDPVDNHFVRRPVLDMLLKERQVGQYGRQITYTIDTGENPTIKDFSGYDTFDLAAPDTVVTIVYPMVNKGGVIMLSWEDKLESAGNDHRTFDLVKQRRANALKTLSDQLATDLFAATQVASKITSLAVMIDSTGTTGSVSATTVPDWASTETASGSFAGQGLSDMRTLYNTLVNNGSMPNLIVTTQSVFEFYEKEVDPDVRYSVAQGTGGRGFKTLEFKGMPIVHDLKCNSGVLYMIDKENLFFKVESAGNFTTDEFQTPINQKASVAKMAFRGQLITDRRKSHGKLTGIVA